MKNILPILIITYRDDKDLNVSIARDELIYNRTQDEIKDRSLDIEFIQKDEVEFDAKLYDYDGSIVFETNKWTKNTFDEVSRVIDNLPAKEPKGINDTLESETLSLTIPSDTYDTEIEEEEEEIVRLDDDQERDTELIGVDYPNEGNYTKQKYMKMKNKYLDLKKRFMSQFNQD